jgi:hypothetical protein
MAEEGKPGPMKQIRAEIEKMDKKWPGQIKVRLIHLFAVRVGIDMRDLRVARYGK